MNLILLYLGIFLAILVIAIFLKIIKGAIKIFFFASFVIFIFLLITGFFVVKDANEFKDRFPSEENIFLLVQNESLIAGFKVLGANSPYLMTSEDLSSIASYVENNSFEELDAYKIFKIEIATFDDSLKEGVNYEGLGIDKSLAIEVFNSDDPLTVLAKAKDENNWLSIRSALEDDLTSPSEAKAALFAVLMVEKFASGPSFIFYGLKDGLISVYPETPLFIAIKIIPESVFDKIAGEEEVYDGNEILEER